MPKLTINGTEIEVEKGTSILQASELLGVEIPRFCYHDRLSVPANCRMCLVEVEGAPKPVASCAMAAGDGMVVKTDSQMVHKARKGVMEFLLINHPLDCPICDQGGECDLQDQAFSYGFDRSRYAENKRAVKDKELGPFIKTIMTRCIQCTRCIRFGEEIAGTPDLGLLNRGENVEIGTFVEKMTASELSGNMIDICPVGALTSKPYAFKARPWELKKTETIDVHDAVGSNIRVDARGPEVMRVLPRLHEDINEEWISDKTRFAYDGLKQQRLDRPYLKKDGKLQPCSWEEAFLAIGEKFSKTNSNRVAALAGDLLDVDTVVAFKDFITGLGIKNIDCRVDGALFDPHNPVGYTFNTGIAGLEEADAILLVGTNPRVEAPILNARIRKAWLNTRVKIAYIGPGEPDLTYPYEKLGDTLDALDKLQKARSGFAKLFKSAEKPVLMAGQALFQREDGMAVHHALFQFAEKVKLVKENWNGFNVLHTAAGRVGALTVGFVPQNDGLNSHEIKDALANGQIDILYLAGVDNFDVKALRTDKAFVIYQGHHGDAGAGAADVILPGAAYTEKDGFYMNTEGRIQLAKQAVYPPGEAREDWKIFRALSEMIGRPLPYNTAFDLRARITSEWPQFAMIDTLPAHAWSEFGVAGDVDLNVPLCLPVDNFYMTNVITKASVNMAQATAAFLEGRKDYKEAA